MDASHSSVQVRTAAGLLCILAFVLQMLYLSHSFDAYQLVQYSDVNSWRSVFGYLGKFAKLLILFVVLICLGLYRELPRYYASAIANWQWARFVGLLFVQFCAYAVVYLSSASIFNADSLVDVTALVMLIWAFAASIWAMATLFALVSAKSVIKFLKANGFLLVGLSFVSICIWWLTVQTSEFWGPLSEYTFVLAIGLLLLVTRGDIYADFDLKELGLSDFAVNIAPACSGYEGIGLVCSFVGVYLHIHKKDFKFPQALLLFPIGALLIWLLNVVRIVVLILIGEHWSPDIAVEGFHSQAGWLTFIIASLVILWVAGSMRFFTYKPSKVAVDAATKPIVPDVESTSGKRNIAVETLLPMVTLLAVILLSSALSSGFDWFYPVRVIAVVAVLVWVWPRLGPMLSFKLPDALMSRKTLESFLVGGLVAVLWFGMLTGKGAELDREIGDTLAASSFWLAALWLIFRFIGASITVSIAEELAFRGYLLCKLSAAPVSIDKPLPVSVLAVALSSLAFGFLHGAWFAGTVAGLLYAFVRYRTGHVGYAIFAHSSTNALLCVYAAISGEWSLL